MILDARDGLRGIFVRVDTNQPVRWVIWYDTETTEFEAYRTDPDIAARLGVLPEYIRYRGTARLRLIPSAPVQRAKPTALHDAEASYREAKLLYAKPIIMVDGQECDERYCHRLAEYQTAHERVIEPIVGADGHAYKRSIVTDVKNWCSKHYRLPQRISERGVESETEVAVRPQ